MVRTLLMSKFSGQDSLLLAALAWLNESSSLPHAGDALQMVLFCLFHQAHKLGILKTNKAGLSLLLSFVHQLGENMNLGHRGPSTYTAWKTALSDKVCGKHQHSDKL